MIGAICGAIFGPAAGLGGGSVISTTGSQTALNLGSGMFIGGSSSYIDYTLSELWEGRTPDAVNLVKDSPKWDPMRIKFAQMLKEIRQVGTVRRDVKDPKFFAAFGGESIESGMWFRYNPNNLRSVDMIEEVIHWQQYKKGLYLSGYSDEALEIMAKRSIINNYNIGPGLKRELLHDIQRVFDGTYTNPK